MCAVNKQVKVVQFIHPGGEHQPSVRNIKNGKVIFPWNYGSHRRKYINTKGDYVDFNNNDNWRYLNPQGSWAETGISMPAGEIAFALAYNYKFYGDRAYYSDDFYNRIF